MTEIEQLISNNTKSDGLKRGGISGKVLIGITGGIGLGLSIICIPFVSPAFRKYCLPYVPATTKQIENVLELIPKNRSSKLLDIGSGDGRIVITTAKYSNYVKCAHGVELNPWLVYYSRISALSNGVFGKTKFFRQNLWKFDTSVYNCVVIFGVEQMMPAIESKLLTELKSNTEIIACRFPLPTLKPDRTIDSGVDTVWSYHIKK